MKFSETRVSNPDNKNELINQEIVEFKKAVAKNFEINDATKIYDALDLMLELHSDQKPYSNGRPYPGHLLSVADDLVNKYEIKDKDLIIAGLLHDSVEDQGSKLQAKRLQRIKNEDTLGPSAEHEALLEIGDLFGDRVKKVVSRLTNPNFKKLILNLKQEGIEKSRNELYADHVREAISDIDSFVVKFSDFMVNAVAVSTLPENTKEEQARKIKFKEKYGPVIKTVFLPAFKKMKKDHPLYPKKKEIIKELQEVFEKNYT